MPPIPDLDLTEKTTPMNERIYTPENEKVATSIENPENKTEKEITSITPAIQQRNLDPAYTVDDIGITLEGKTVDKRPTDTGKNIPVGTGANQITNLANITESNFEDNVNKAHTKGDTPASDEQS